MSGGGSGTQTSTTTTGLPAWEKPFARNYLNAINALVLPGGKPAPYPQGLNQNVAPFTPFQNQAFNLGGSLTPQAQGLADIGAGGNALYASGAMVGPNPYLNAYAQAAGATDVNQYLQATQPSLMAQAEQSGTLNSSGFDQAQSNAQFNLGQSLASLNAGIYEPAYQLGTQEQLQAAQQTPGLVQGLYTPTQALYGLGSAQQQQQQNVLNAATQNAQQQVNFPFNLLQQLGVGLGLASGGGGVTKSVAPVPGGK